MFQLVPKVIMSQSIFEFILQFKDTLFAFLSIIQSPFVILSFYLLFFQFGVTFKTDDIICYILPNRIKCGSHIFL